VTSAANAGHATTSMLHVSKPSRIEPFDRPILGRVMMSSLL